MKGFFASIIDTISPLLHSLQGEKGDKLKALLDSREGVPGEAFAEVLTLEDARTLGFLMSFDDEAELSRGLPEISLQDGLTLRKLVEEKLAGLMDHPAVNLLMEKAVNADETGGPEEDDKNADKTDKWPPPSLQILNHHRSVKARFPRSFRDTRYSLWSKCVFWDC